MPDDPAALRPGETSKFPAFRTADAPRPVSHAGAAGDDKERLCESDGSTGD
jgi:hypothetical protein